MFSAMIEKTVRYSITAGIVPERDKDIYVYGLDLILFTALNIFAVLTLALLFHKTQDTLLLLSVVLPLQLVGGGYHAQTHFRCFSIMVLGWCCVMPLAAYLTPLPAVLTAGISVVTIFLLAPVRHVNVPMSEKRRQKMKKAARLLGTFFALLSILLIGLFPVHAHIGAVCALGLGIIAFSMLCAQVKQRFSAA